MATTASNNKNLSTRMKAIEIAKGFFNTAELKEYQTMSLLQELDAVIAQPTGSTGPQNTDQAESISAATL